MRGRIGRLLGRGDGASRRRGRGFAPELMEMEARRLLSVYTVTNTSGDASTAGSLPWAAIQADYTTPGLDYIVFNIPGNGPFVIDVGASLFFNDRVVVDATSQPGYNGSPLITVRGNANVPSVFTLTPGSSGSLIQGFAVSNYFANAITILPGSDGDYIQYNWLGFYKDASNNVHLNSALHDNTAAVGLQSNYTVIQSNTISGTYNGVILLNGDESGDGTGDVYTGNVIRYNNIGTDPTASTSSGYGNAHSGVFLGAGAHNTYIGPGNVISGNAVIGVEMLTKGAQGNVVFANLIGTDIAGKTAIPNGVGVLLAQGAQGNVIGGPWGGNVVSGNLRAGVALGNPDYPGASGNYVHNNVIGLNAAQTAVIPGQDSGIGMQAGVTSTSVQYNVIAGNTNNGIVLANSTSNYMANNLIGMSGYGTAFPNGAFGVAFLAGANYNWLVGNAYGPNKFGKGYVDKAAVGNYTPDLVAAYVASQSAKKASARKS